ncbi:MAG: nucleotidyltransferase domain-containing protein [Legionellaceae bacterium]|nr:nucleotidyltransferase domain-containing protein [Legionellaceae bacterium]
MNTGLTQAEAQIIRSILSHFPYAFLAFGSRVKGTHKPYSDLDLCYQAYIPDAVIAEIEDQFEQSDLPFKVDLVSWARCSRDFQAIIQHDCIPLETLLKR